ncbi:hypothetical protein [Pisciglobus halotolerans]|uniref:hypothetical protein n=1 Tax=Pisciglobus halotolerans TaxID=745365 RepID=UPI003CCC25DE
MEKKHYKNQYLSLFVIESKTRLRSNLENWNAALLKSLSLFIKVYIYCFACKSIELSLSK